MTTAAPPLGPVAPPRRLTPEEYADLPDDGRLYELVDGQLVEKRMSDLAHLVANNIGVELALWARQSDGGQSFVEGNFRCFPHDPGMVRRPDVAYVSTARLAGYQWGQSFLTVVPDLVAEVVSPRDEVYDLDRKIVDYFRAGVRRVWVVNPEQQTVRVHRAPGDLSEWAGDVEVGDEEVLPGFRCRLADLFKIPAAPQA